MGIAGRAHSRSGRARPALIRARSATARAVARSRSPTPTWCSGAIPPHLLGGEIPLDAGAARAGLADLAAKLGMPAEDCAAGILEVSAWNQANAVRQITVQRGLDVRDFTLVTFGGSGSLLVCPLIEILGVRGVLVPGNPGNVSAFGLLTVDVRADYVRTRVARQSELDYPAMEATYAGLAAQARDALTAQGFAPGEHRLLRTADLRYFGQAFEVRVPVAADPVGPAQAEAAAAAFHAAHRALYGYDFRGNPRQQVEWVNLRVTGIGPIQRPRIATVAARNGGAAGEGPAEGHTARAVTGRRPVVFGRGAGPADAAIYWRPSLAAGDEVAGPAIIEEYGATVPVHPGFVARVDCFGNLLVNAA